MDTQQIALVRTTMALLAGHEEVLAKDFYQRFFASHPGVGDLFPADLTAQQRKLIDELAWMVAALERVDALVERAVELGRRHASHGVEAHHYVAMPPVLIASLTTVLGDQFTPEMAAAWRRALHLITETMQIGARW